MKKKIIIAVCVVAAAGLCLWQYSAVVTAEDTLIRFHVIANSDSGEDQAVKLKVRDAILAKYRDELGKTDNYNEAYNFLAEHREEMAKTAKATLEEWGFTYGAKVEMGHDVFPTKTYGDLTLPAGEYQAVKIILGDGNGKNWWCVMFPPLCFVDLSQNVGVAKLEKINGSQGDYIIPAGAEVTEVKVKSKLAEILN